MCAYSPLSTIQNGVVEFKIEGTRSFLDLQYGYIYTKARIINADDTNLAADKEVSVVNYLAGTLWKTGYCEIKWRSDRFMLRL